MGRRILIAEDDRDTLWALSRILAEYDVAQAADGRAALNMIASWRPEVVLLDVDMPGLNGLEVLRRIGKTGRRPLVIMVTADTSLETIKQALSEGIFAYLQKPLERERVLDQVRRAFAFLDGDAPPK